MSQGRSSRPWRKDLLTLSRIELRIPCVNTLSHPGTKSLCSLSYRCIYFYHQDNININTFVVLFSILNIILSQTLWRYNYRPAVISSCASSCKFESRCSSVKSWSPLSLQIGRDTYLELPFIILCT